ncbi:MAG: MerR family transcriptional regulator [Acidisphaera sp.]|nr:MerR family transcriptional regulator [Acidisphaera sp.]
MSADQASDRPDPDAPEAGRAKLRKAPNAFRTISEVADDLHIPQHVLRFWETKFPQVKPLKRGGGRRYYRPDDIALLRRISDLLYIQGYTIKGVQRLLREGGGKLSDDIPPPAPDEQAETEPEAEEPQLPMPGLSRPEAAPPIARSIGKAVPKVPAAPEAPSPDGESAQENARLRQVLARMLAELEELRALLP